LIDAAFMRKKGHDACRGRFLMPSKMQDQSGPERWGLAPPPLLPPFCGQQGTLQQPPATCALANSALSIFFTLASMSS